MPDQVRIISKTDRRFDRYIDDLVADRGYGRERIYAGVEDQEKADEVRRKLRAAGRHRGVSVKAYWRPCEKRGRCPAGASCRFHVHYSAYKPDDARAYKERLARQARS